MASHAAAAPLNSRLSSIVEIYLSAKNLPNMDTFSKSDPFVVVYVQSDMNTNSAQSRPSWIEARARACHTSLHEYMTQIDA